MRSIRFSLFVLPLLAAVAVDALVIDRIERPILD
jgi:hypothetical protein